ncbi:MAG: membrane protein insertase YidC [Vicinamibacteria bacterium]
MEERRLLIAVALSLLVLTAYQMMFPPAPAPRPTPARAVSAPPSAADARPSPPAEAARAARPSPVPTVPPLPRVADERERRVEVRGPDVTAAFSNRGARLVSWQLERYRDGRGRPEDMVQAVPQGARVLEVETGEPEIDARLREALFLASSEAVQVAPSGETELRFEYSDGTLAASKRLRFQPRGYLISLEASVRQDGRELPLRLGWGPGVGNPSEAELEVRGAAQPNAVALATHGGVERHTPDKLVSPLALPEVHWAGVESHYFAALLVPPRSQGAALLRAGAVLPRADGTAQTAAEALVALEPGAGPAFIYVGPKDYHLLAPLGHDLRRVVNVGDWIGPLVVPLMSLLRWVHGFVGNYGWSIVVLTVLINLAMGPLRHYSIANGFKMAKLQPEMKVIQERYRKVPALDPRRQQMQEEIAALYARHGMSMSTQLAVGCVPILLTMPFLFAFYRMLDVSIDLRGAGFLWIHDLSQKDPLFITPVLMGVSMLVMQKLTPSTMDPAQQRMMLLMPVVFMGMFLWAPAGLNLYWLVANVCAIVQQGITLRLLRHERPAKEKRHR